ncbi:MAG: FAD-binding oxidoreductase [Betaproteobacteria bacterium]|nr:FAD-binding oxidoreductase [Betaproteobacteria bacterium]
MLATPALPLSALELREVVRQAQRFDPARLDRVLRLDAARGLVEVQASASWTALAAHLRPSCPPFAQAWERFGTIAAAVEANAAGPDGRPVVAHVESLALVTADGELRTLTRDRNAELFSLAVGGQGLFGALYSATLRLESLAAAGDAPSAVESLALDASMETRSRSLRILVPPSSVEGFLAETRERCGEWRTAIHAVSVRRTLPESETALRWARNEYAEVTLLLAERDTLGGSVRTTQLCRELIDASRSRGGTFAIASTPEATRAQVDGCYPELKRVLAEKRRFDPAEKLTNDWYRHHRSLLGREGCEVRWNRGSRR